MINNYAHTDQGTEWNREEVINHREINPYTITTNQNKKLRSRGRKAIEDLCSL